MKIADLRNELQNDPATLGYAALIAASNDQVAFSITVPADRAAQLDVVRSDFLKWAATTGMRSVIQDESVDAGSPVRDSAIVLNDVCRGSTDGIDFSQAENVALLDGWVAASKLTTLNKDALLALATADVARSINLFGQLITANHVAQAVRDDAGDSLIV